MIIYEGKYTNAKVMIDEVEETCAAQINHFINHPAFTNPVVIMPDTHAGKGSVIGFTMEMADKVIPNTIGVDIGCGMLSVNLGPDIHLDYSNFCLEKVDDLIREAIPFGFEVHSKKSLMNMERDFPWTNKGFPWKATSEKNRRFCMAFNKKFNKRMTPTEYDYKWFLYKCVDIGMDPTRASNSLGTLGGGNHFIEIGVSDNKDTWLTVHTGSRQLGEKTCRYWQTVPAAADRKEAEKTFKTELNRIKDTYTTKAQRKEIPGNIKELKEKLGLDRPLKSRELDWLEGEHMEGYLTDMIFAQTYADVNRQLITSKILEILDLGTPTASINTVHNYINFNDFIIRKGAVASYKDQLIIIPFNMRDGILICEGKSNPEWNYSAPHGAGRVLSRSKAKQVLDMAEFKEQMKGIYSTSVVKSTLDEAPNAYKDPKIIEEAIGPTATIVDRIKPIINLKSM